MAFIRKIDTGDFVSAFPMQRRYLGSSGNAYGGVIPFEKLLQPNSRIEVLHAEISSNGHLQFSPVPADEFVLDPDIRYKVLTYSGSITVPDGQEPVPPPDPEPPDYEPQTRYFAKTTTDSRIFTYVLEFVAPDEPDPENPDGWRIEITGERTTGERFIYATKPSDEDPPESYIIPNECDDPTEKVEPGALVYEGEIKMTLSEPVEASYLNSYCEDKLSWMKENWTSTEYPVSIQTEIDSHNIEFALSVKRASVRQVWTGSKLFTSLPGNLIYFTSPLTQNYSLIRGDSNMNLSDEIPDTERYFDPAGLYGESNFWNSDHSPFSLVPVAQEGGSFNIRASYPGYGSATNDPGGDTYARNFKKAEVMFFCYDGKRRKFKAALPVVGSEQEIENVTTNKSNVFQQASKWIEVDLTDNSNLNISGIMLVDEQGKEIPDPTGKIGCLIRARWRFRWGFVGFNSRRPPPESEGEEPVEPYPILETRYRTASISGSRTDNFKDSDSPPTGLVGLTSNGSWNGSLTLTKPTEVKLGSPHDPITPMGGVTILQTKSTPAYQSQFELQWSAGGGSGSVQTSINMSHDRYVGIFITPPISDDNDASITDSSYSLSEPRSTSPGDRPYRMRWLANQKNKQPKPALTTITFTLGAPDPTTGKQVSSWVDIPLPEAGKFHYTETTSDPLSSYVG